MAHWALLIGISKYQHPELESSPVAVTNVKALDQFLQRAGYTTICLHDGLDVSNSQQPTRFNIQENLGYLLKAAADDDVIVIYFAGCGVRQNETFMLFAQDAGSDTDGIWLDQIQDILGRRETLRSLLVLEIMQSINFPILSLLSSNLTGSILFTNTAPKQEEQLRSEAGKGNSIFMNSLLEGLSGKADNDRKGSIIAEDLGQYVVDAMYSVQNDTPGIVQVPRFLRNDNSATLTLVDFNSLSVRRTPHRAQCFTEPTIRLDLMLIPGGTFLMGSPPDELERYEDEGPQHSVTVSAFLIGRYPVTQAQWRSIASREDLKVNETLNPNSGHFKGDHHPVERVSWYGAVEFCDRLSRLTGHSYRLPTEAEWEYACRAGTATPFHFGETITTDLANYNGTDSEDGSWSGSYGNGPKGIYRATTTPVNEFPIANAFGLCDMHGNVWEWCLDHWHEDYNDAPIDGSAWLTNQKDAVRVRRGGCWDFNPRDCRSAVRDNYKPNNRYDALGFRVVCEIRGL